MSIYGQQLALVAMTLFPSREMKHLKFRIGIMRSEHLHFKETGNVVSKCPKCGLGIEIALSKLEDDPSITPVVTIESDYERDTNI